MSKSEKYCKENIEKAKVIIEELILLFKENKLENDFSPMAIPCHLAHDALPEASWWFRSRCVARAVSEMGLFIKEGRHNVSPLHGGTPQGMFITDKDYYYL
jgi:hypothetical protein